MNFKPLFFIFLILPGYCFCMTICLFGCDKLAGQIASDFYLWCFDIKIRKYKGIGEDNLD